MWKMQRKKKLENDILLLKQEKKFSFLFVYVWLNMLLTVVKSENG